MITRKQRLAKECTHDEYFSQFVNDRNKQTVIQAFGVEKLVESHLNGRDCFNDIPLKHWDGLPVHGVSALMAECGDYLTQAGSVSILKQCAQHIVRDSLGVYYPDYVSLLGRSEHIDEPECQISEDRPLQHCKDLETALRASEHLSQREKDTLNNLTKVVWRKDGDVTSAELVSERVNPDWLQFQIVVYGGDYQKPGDIVG